VPRVIPTDPAVSERYQGSTHTIIQGILNSRFLISFPYKYEQSDINDSIFKRLALSATQRDTPQSSTQPNHPHMAASLQCPTALQTMAASLQCPTALRTMQNVLKASIDFFCSSSSTFDVSFVHLLPSPPQSISTRRASRQVADSR